MKVLTLKPTKRIRSPGIRDSGLGIGNASPTSRFADVYAQRAAAERVSPAVCERPHRDARRRVAGGAARSVDAKVIIDRVKLEGDMRGRLTDSIEMAYREAGGTAFAIEDPGLSAEAH